MNNHVVLILKASFIEEEALGRISKGNRIKIYSKEEGRHSKKFPIASADNSVVNSGSSGGSGSLFLALLDSVMGRITVKTNTDTDMPIPWNSKNLNQTQESLSSAYYLGLYIICNLGYK